MPGNKKKFVVPQILVLISGLIVIFSVLSYFVPGGEYQLDESKRAIAGTFSYVGVNPVSLWQALLAINKGVIASASIISLLLVCGGSVAVVISTGCFEDLLNYGIFKLEDKSVKVLVPSIVVLMSALGAFAGNDSMIAFVTVGMLISRRLRLDAVCAMAMFYLGYQVGQGSSFTNNLLIIVQSMCDVVPLSGMTLRIGVWILFTGIAAVYCTRYALKISRDPSRSLTGVLSAAQEEGEVKETKLPVRALFNTLTLFVCYVIFAIGSKLWKWNNDYLIAIMVLDVLLTGIIYKMNPNDIGKEFFKGAQSMGGICVVLGLAKVIGTILTESKMVNTIAHMASTMLSGLGIGGAAIGIFIFILLFNMLIPSCTSKAAILLPLLCPISDVVGITRDALVVTFMIGDSLTNSLTPVSGPLCGALGLAGVDYSDWIKFSIPLMFTLAVTGGIIIAVLSATGWVG
ncbi:MAG: YfcC family protein [Synergistaceae bacterium]|nr:YfcC family protein [Synergistaceae bacterium]